MGREIYLRPVGLLSGDVARSAVTAGKAGWLAGGQMAFSLLEMIERGEERPLKSLRSFHELSLSGDKYLKDYMQRLTRPRADLLGLSMATPHIMGIINVTPDSFSDGGLYETHDTALAHGRALIKEGASILDIGGESTRPGADLIDEEDEKTRILPVIEGLKDEAVRLSIDSRKAGVMKAAIAAGADLINDVSALTFEEASLDVACACQCPVVLMHAQGDPKSMQDQPDYGDVLLDVYDALLLRIETFVEAGGALDKVIIDPGIGFGKTRSHNLTLLHGLSLFHGAGVPLLLGLSRKSIVGAIAGELEPQKRVSGSVAGALQGILQGVQILRVHDVYETSQACAVWQASLTGQMPGVRTH